MKTTRRLNLVAAALACAVAFTTNTQAQIPASITTPDKVETRIGTLEFKDGAPSKDTLARVYDNVDFIHAYEAFVNTFQGVNAEALKKGFADIGVPDNRKTHSKATTSGSNRRAIMINVRRRNQTIGNTNHKL